MTDRSNRRIVVVGSVNVDLMVRCAHLPSAGETVMGSEFTQAPGGKGANQAVAAARLGAAVSLIGCIGEDSFGRQSLAGFEAAGIDTEHLRRIGGASTGIAMITSDADGENCIAISSGATQSLTPQHLDDAEALIASAGMVVCQFESPLSTVLRALSLARRHQVPVLLNPAPVQPIELRLLGGLEVLVLNAIEAAMLSALPVANVHQVSQVAEFLRSAGIQTVIVTLGKDGIVMAAASGTHHLAAPKVVAVDSTGAGDTFVGALSCSLVAGNEMVVAVEYAQHAAAFSVTKRGAQASMPLRSELEEFLATRSKVE